jgi:chemotaxis protein CheZ
MQSPTSPGAVPDTPEQLLNRIGQLTRQMREGLRELGLDKGLTAAAEAIPDARERLSYIARMSEQAANRTLNAVEQAQPLQDGLAQGARDLSQRWNGWFAQPIELREAGELVNATRDYLARVPTQTAATHAELMAIMMAQDFQGKRLATPP